MSIISVANVFAILLHRRHFLGLAVVKSTPRVVTLRRVQAETEYNGGYTGKPLCILYKLFNLGIRPVKGSVFVRGER